MPNEEKPAKLRDDGRTRRAPAIPPAPPPPPKGSPLDKPVTVYPDLSPDEAIRRIAPLRKK